MAIFVFIDEFGNDLLKGVHVFGTHTIKAVLSNVEPVVATAHGYSNTNVTEIATGGGYTQGTLALTGVTLQETAAGTGIWRVVSNDVAWTATAGGIATFQYIILYNDTPTTPVADPIIGYLDNGSAVNLADGSTFTADVGVDGWFSLTIPNAV